MSQEDESTIEVFASELKRGLQELRSSNETDFNRLIYKVRTLRERFYGEIAAVLEPILNARLSALPPDSLDRFDQKRELCKRVNALARETGLALADSEGHEAYLRADIGHNPVRGRFQLCATRDHGSKVSMSSQTLFHLRLRPSLDRHIKGVHDEHQSSHSR